MAARVARLLWREALDALLPQQCLVCGRFGAPLHEACVTELPQATPPRCGRCWRPGPALCGRCVADPPPFEALRAPFRFAGDARRAILEAKFAGVTALLPPLARAAAALVPPGWQVEAVVPVPLHPRRRRRRGFNQAELAASAVAEELGVPLRSGLLRRVRAGPAQARLTAAERARNVAGAFEAAGPVAGRVLVVDDVTTTGTTLREAARTLSAGGAACVFALALARED